MARDIGEIRAQKLKAAREMTQVKEAVEELRAGILTGVHEMIISTHPPLTGRFAHGYQLAQQSLYLLKEASPDTAALLMDYIDLEITQPLEDLLKELKS